MNSDGIVFPRMDKVQRDALNAIEGQCIFNTDTKSINCFTGNSWNESKCYSIGPFDAIRDDGMYVDHHTIYYEVLQSDERGIYIPVHLPHNSTFEKITFHYTDLDPNKKASLFFYVTPLSGAGSPYGAGVFTIDGSNQSLVIDNIPFQIDNSMYSYSVRVVPFGDSLDDKIQFHGASIQYFE